MIWLISNQRKTWDLVSRHKGQIVIPAKARKTFDINPGDQLVVLGDEAQGLAVIKAESFLSIAEEVKKLQKATPEV